MAGTLGILVFVAIFMSGCNFPPALTGSPTPMATSTPTETPVPTASPTPTVTPTPSGITVVRPSDEALELILNNVIPDAEGEETGHVTPPSAHINKLAQIFKIAGSNLQQPVCCQSFNAERATTYTQPGAGTFFQIVSLQNPADSFLPAALEAPNGKGLVIGGIIAYRTTPLQIDTDPAYDVFEPTALDLPAGDYLIALYGAPLGGDASEPVVRLIGQPQGTPDDSITVIEAGHWQLRQLQEQPAAAPFSFISSDQICLSQIEMQACVNAIAPGLTNESSPSATIAAGTLEKLQVTGRLPDGMAFNLAGALASVDAVSSIERCDGALDVDNAESCQPSVVAAAALSPVPENEVQFVTASRPNAPRLASTVLQASPLISETVVGTGIMSVFEAQSDDVIDQNGAVATLPPGDYRVDLIQSRSGDWLAQFVPAVGDEMFYAQAVEVEAEGALVNLSLAPLPELLVSEVALDRVLWSACHPNGNRQRCSASEKKRPYCVNFQRGFGWCDVIGG